MCYALSKDAHQFASHLLKVPNTCSSQARGAEIAQLRHYRISEIPLVSRPRVWMCTRQHACVNFGSRSMLE